MIHGTVLELRTRHAFQIARAAAHAARRNVWVRVLGADGVEGWGEAAATAYYGETAETVQALLPRYAAVLEREWRGEGLPPIERLERALEREVGRNPAARAAVSAALHDLTGKLLGQPIWRLWGLDPAAPVSSFTLGIAEPEVLRERAAEAAWRPVLKLKLGTPHDEAMLVAVREGAPGARLRVDANTGWTARRALDLLPLLEELEVELIEQPFPPGDVASFRLLGRSSRIPIIADESCLAAADVPRLAGYVDGVNLKLAKTGSLREAVRLVHVARAHGMSVMLGCMIESTLGIAAAAQLAPLVDYLDLDGAALLAADPFDGPAIDGEGHLRLNGAPGLGVTRGRTPQREPPGNR